MRTLLTRIKAGLHCGSLLLACIALAAYGGAAPAAGRVGGNGNCFGAAGAGCGMLQPGSAGTAYCRPALGSSDVECIVHAGSIEHDSCCFRSPEGRECGGRNSQPQQCAYEWDKSQQRTSQGLYWTRRLNPRESNTSGLVDFDKLCAPSGTVLAAGDERYCCSRASVATGEHSAGGVIKLRCR